MPISRTFIQIISKNGFWGVFSVFSFFFPSIHKLYLTWLYCKELQFMTFTFLDLLSTPLVVSFLCLLSISLEHYVVYGKQKCKKCLAKLKKFAIRKGAYREGHSKISFLNHLMNQSALSVFQTVSTVSVELL